jgi:flagellar export protein FliJ
MKPFSFRLDRILHYRERLEKSARNDLAVARNEYREKDSLVNSLAAERMELAKRCSDEGFAGIDVPFYLMYKSVVKTLHSELEGAHVVLNKAGENVEAREMVLKRRSIERKMLEALRDLERRIYNERREKEEQKVIDELVIIRRGRNS